MWIRKEIIMAAYEWKCEKCGIYWERDYPFAKAPKRTKCPECQTLSERYFGQAPPVRFKGAGWTGVNSQTGFNKTGGSDEVNKKLQDQCNNRMETGWQHYSRYTPPKKLLDTKRRLSDEEVRKKLDDSKRLSAHNYDKAGIDPYKKYKPQ